MSDTGTSPAPHHAHVPKATSTLDVIIAQADRNEDGLKRTMGATPLIAIGVAAVVGAGIFVVTGHAAATKAGPAVIISFCIAGFAAMLSALCYAELSSMIPLSGSTYSYAYASLGTFIAFIVGWDLMSEYLFGSANVANGWSGYFKNLLGQMGITLPDAIAYGPVADHPGDLTGIVNLPAVALIVFVTWLLIAGSKESSRATTIFVIVKLTTLALFVVVGVTAISPENYSPFVPPNTGEFGSFGWSGVVGAAGIVFYSFISFDAVCTAAQEARNPRRTVPLGVMGSLGIATLLYVVVGAVLVGLVPYQSLDVSDPLSAAVNAVGLDWLGTVIDIGAVIGLAASVLALLFAQTRILMRMSEDGMLPKIFGRVDKKRGTPMMTTLICGAVAAVMTGVLPLSILTELISIGTLLAFIVVSVAVIVLRRTEPDLKRPFRIPGGYAIPTAAIIVSICIMLTLQLITWLWLISWLIVGTIVYFSYSKKRAKALIGQRLARHNEIIAEELAVGITPPPESTS